MPADDSIPNRPIIDEAASESLAVAPPPPGGAEGAAASQSGDAGGSPDDTTNPQPPKIRTAMDATDHATLARHPEDEDAKLDVALDESFPTSDAPSNTQPGRGLDPAPSSGFDADEEKARMAAKE